MKNILKLSPSNLFLGILGFEAIISLINLSVIPGVMPVVQVIGNVLPVVDNFMHKTIVHPSVAPYIALTSALLPLKVFVAYILVLQLSPEDKLTLISFPSSNATVVRKIYGTILVLILNVGFVWYVFSYGDAGYFDSDSPPGSAASKYRLVSEGGIKMWLGWAVMHLVCLALVLGLLLAFVDE